MLIHIKHICFLIALLVMPGLAVAQDARQIMEIADEKQRLANNSVLSLSKLSSCSFAVKNKKVSCSDSPRVKVVESASIQLGNNKKDTQGISIILEPPREKGIGMLTYSYDDSSRNTESWLYLSALGKVKRMVSGSGDDQEPVAFFGSEFTTEDMENGKTDEYDYKVLQEGKYGKTEVWVIEALPKPVRLKKTNYSKLLIWIEKGKYIPLKIQGYDKYGKLYKRTMFKNYQEIESHWIAREITVFNLKIKRLSTLTSTQIALDVDIEPEFLTQRSLVDFAFREANLSALRKQFK